MQINNTLINERLASTLNSANLSERQARPDQQARLNAPAPVAEEVDQDALAAQSEIRQEQRVQRLNTLESAPLRTQQAISTYQSTEQAFQSSEQGELVGIDLFA